MVAIIIICLLIILAIVYSILTYKKLITLRQEVRKTWNTLVTNLDERFKILIKYIVLLQRIAPDQREVLQKGADAICYANAAKSKADKIAADTVLRNSIDKLFNIYVQYNVDAQDNERLYPNLYVLTEKISALRQDYNLAVKYYNDKVLKYPSKIIALLTRFKPDIYYEVDVSNRKGEVESL